MRRLTLILLAAAAVALIGAAPGSARRDDPAQDGATILVKFAPGVDAKGRIADEGDNALGELKTKVLIVKVKNGSSVDDAIARYSARDDVEYAEPNSVATADALAAPNDASYGSQWALPKIGLLAGWALYPGSYVAGGGPTIAIVDTGVDSTHEDLNDGRVLTASGANCVSGTCASSSALDDNGHGTHVTGIAAAETNNLVGIAGEAFSWSVIPVKVLDSTGSGTYAAVSSGIIWAADHGARVVNLSLSGTAYSKTVCDAVTYAISHSAVVVAAAGNDTTSIQEYPAACPGAVGVGATDSTDAPATFSDFGYPDAFVAAPGVSILSTVPGGYATESGTSMAAPYVSGLAALLIGESPSRKVADVKRIIASTADKVGSAAYSGDPFAACPSAYTWTSSFGYGRINAARALGWVSSPDFALSASPSSISVGQSAQAVYTASVSAFDGYTGTVGLSVSGLPTGATASFSPTSLAGGGSSQLTVTTSATTPGGTYKLTISGSGGSVTRTASVTLVVTVVSDFTLSVSPISASVARGKSVSVTVTVAALGSFAGKVSFSVSGLPTKATGSFTPTSVTKAGTSTLKLTASTSTPVGAYTITVKGTSGTLVHSAPITLTVT